MERSRGLVHLAALLALAAVYFVAGKLGLALAFAHPSASPVWPPTGIALAAVLLLGPRVWPAIFAGAFLVNASTAGSIATSLGIAAGNTLEAVAGGWLVTRFARGADAFERPQDVFKFALLAAVASSALSATVGVTVLGAGGFAAWSDYGRLWSTWWLGDAAGALLVTPALVAWLRPARSATRWTRARGLEAAALLAAILAVGSVVVFGIPAPWPFLCLPLAIWAAFRFGPRETTATVLIFSAIAIWGSIRGSGPFSEADPNRELLLLQLFMGVISLTSLTLTAVLCERRRALEALEWQALELARSNADLEAFAYVVSHDLKAPLRGISSLAAWVIEDCRALLPRQSAEHLSLIDRRVQRMSRLIDGVLAYSRIGRTGAALERVDANSLLEEVVDSLGPTRASIRVEGRLPALRYNRTQLAQVFQNLIANAVQHMGRDGGEVVVSCRERPDAFEFAVRDDGVGIDQRHFERIFRMFQALDPDRETTGVGLTIVKKIVELHGGAVEVESTPGAGATFRFSVPKQPRGRQGAPASSQRLQ
jgi:signal transduction histidine kinase